MYPSSPLARRFRLSAFGAVLELLASEDQALPYSKVGSWVVRLQHHKGADLLTSVSGLAKKGNQTVCWLLKWSSPKV